MLTSKRPSMQYIVRKLRGPNNAPPECNPEPLRSEGHAAKYLGITQRALQSWRSRGGGPKYVRLSARAIRYRQCDLDAWIVERLHNDASEYRECASRKFDARRNATSDV